MKKTTVATTMTDPILSKAFACANDYEQAGMLNGMARELFVACRGKAGFESQVCTLTRHLNADGIALIEELHAFVELRKKEIRDA